MKHLLFLLFLVVVGCSSSDVTKYTSLNGTWKFGNDNASGQFDITTENGKMYVSGSSTGSFITVKGTSGKVVKEATSGTTTSPILEISDGSTIGVSFYTTQVNSSYTAINVSGWYYSLNGTNPVTQPAITITRVK